MEDEKRMKNRRGVNSFAMDKNYIFSSLSCCRNFRGMIHDGITGSIYSRNHTVYFLFDAVYCLYANLHFINCNPVHEFICAVQNIEVWDQMVAPSMVVLGTTVQKRYKHVNTL